MGMNRFAVRGLDQETITRPACAVTGTTVVTKDLAQGDILIPAAVTLTGDATMQLPCAAADAGQWWWINTVNVTFAGHNFIIKGTGTDGNVTGSGITHTAAKIEAFYWNGTDLVALTALL